MVVLYLCKCGSKTNGGHTVTNIEYTDGLHQNHLLNLDTGYSNPFSPGLGHEQHLNRLVAVRSDFPQHVAYVPDYPLVVWRRKEGMQVVLGLVTQLFSL